MSEKHLELISEFAKIASCVPCGLSDLSQQGRLNRWSEVAVLNIIAQTAVFTQRLIDTIWEKSTWVIFEGSWGHLHNEAALDKSNAGEAKLLTHY